MRVPETQVGYLARFGFFVARQCVTRGNFTRVRFTPSKKYRAAEPDRRGTRRDCGGCRVTSGITLATQQLSCKRRSLVGEVVREDKIAGLERVFSLRRETSGRVVLVTRIDVERLVVDSAEI